MPPGRRSLVRASADLITRYLVDVVDVTSWTRRRGRDVVDVMSWALGTLGTLLARRVTRALGLILEFLREAIGRGGTQHVRTETRSGRRRCPAAAATGCL